MIQILFKARKAPVGARHKWHDGIYVKQNDHKWHKEKLHDLAHAQLKADNNHQDEELAQDFKEGVEGYIEHLHEKNIHPAKADNVTDHEYWAEFFDDDNWDENKGYWKYAVRANRIAKKFHAHLIGSGKKEEKEDQRNERKAKKEQEKIKKQEKEAGEQLKKRSGVSYFNAIHYAEANKYIARRSYTHEYMMRTMDGMTVTSEVQAKSLIGYSVELNGRKGVVMNYYRTRSAVGGMTFSFGRRRVRRETTGIPMLVILTNNGREKVNNQGPVRILPDPEGPKGSHLKTEPSKSLKSAGISELVFDSNISIFHRESWEKGMEAAFKELLEKMDITLNGKVKIHIYGKGGPKRGALADYSSQDKTIRMSTHKDGSAEALAHELGHALDDKLNRWYGTGGYDIQEIVRAFRSTPQGKEESDRLAREKLPGVDMWGRRNRVSRYTSWMNKDVEVFARCFETYVAKKCPGWKREGWAKEVVREDSWEPVKKALDKLLRNERIKKALGSVLEGRS